MTAVPLALRWCLVGWLGALGCAGAAVAQNTVTAFDATRSHAEFQVRVMWLFSVEGRFGNVTGELRLNHAAQTAQVHASIDATRVSMRRKDHEEWVKSAEFFDAARHPRLTFESAPFPLAVLEQGGDVLGTLTVRGEARPVHFTLRPSECPGHAAHACAVVADGSIQRGDFGMKSHRTTLGDRVRLHLTIFGEKNG
jgi:polyisoprenoid-binding protein YceI